MELVHVKQRIADLSENIGFSYSIGDGANLTMIRSTEERIEVSLPEQVKRFYRQFNGISVDQPALTILPLESFEFLSPNRLLFAVFDGDNNIYFDTSALNAAGQWNIVGENDYVITLTMASFWSNKIWKWVEFGKPFWNEEITL